MAGDYGASLAIAGGAAGGKVKPVLPWPDLRDAHVIVAYDAGVRLVAAMHGASPRPGCAHRLHTSGAELAKFCAPSPAHLSPPRPRPFPPVS